MDLIDRSTHQPRIMGDKSYLLGINNTVSIIPGRPSTHDAIHADLPCLEAEDAGQSLTPAARPADQHALPIASA
jgi:hypothetical protein